MRVRVNYKAYLSGYIAVNYSGKHNGHHFWARHVNKVLRAARITRVVAITNDINVGFYSDSDVVLNDA